MIICQSKYELGDCFRSITGNHYWRFPYAWSDAPNGKWIDAGEGFVIYSIDYSNWDVDDVSYRRQLYCIMHMSGLKFLVKERFIDLHMVKI